MKHIGIITLHGNNYGAVLQAFALNKVINSMGYDALNIAYNDLSRVERGLSTTLKLKNRCWKIVVNVFFKGEKKQKAFDNFRKDYIRFTEAEWKSQESIAQNPPVFDIYVSGSDQIWNPTVINGDYSYLLNFAPDDKKKIAYASSFGLSKLPNNVIEQYKGYLSRYDNIAVRENTGKLIINGLLPEKKVCVVLDPTLLLTSIQWKTYLNIEESHKPFILCYHMPGDKKITEAMFKYAEELSHKTGLAVIHLGLKEYYTLKRNLNFLVGAGPIEFVKLFSSADYVLTNSFHGTAFAANFSKKLVTFVHITAKSSVRHSRITDFLSNINADDAVYYLKDKKVQPIEPFDMSNVQNVLNSYRAKSYEYITAVLGDNK